MNVHEAKTLLSRLLQCVAAGEEITIANRGVPVARLVPLEREGIRRRLGIERDRVRISDDFDPPMRPNVLAGFVALGKGRRKRDGG